ncbi:DNA/RNA nuclease SfsA [Desulfofundulus thermocisternus]|uniref:DNA/RNA nuclease SfsA n=1 Tax=Desulfofundulus thermocisternus TaxID=42471 RepID=UPI002ADE6F7B|nr:DNA/RNA nuclease SfsA [Desulfofundulus thermocisternus]
MVSMLCSLHLPPQLEEAFFIRRLNRFIAEVLVRGNRELAHVPSSGRMAELLVAGRRVWVKRHARAGHKTTCRLLLVEYEGILVSVDATLPNRLVGRALQAGALKEFMAYDTIRAEYTRSQSRFDFYLSGPPGRCLLEVKSVTLVEKGVALFPDAPSVRGTKHLEELVAARREGLQGAVLFVAQREDARCFSPHHRQDPAFAGALQRAAASGVRVLACRCRVTREAVTLEKEIPVLL